MEIKIQLEEEQAQKLAFIQQHDDQGSTEMIHQAVREAIEAYYQKLQQPPQSALERFQNFGLVGCMDGKDEAVSTDDAEIQAYLNQKREQGRL